MKDSVMSTSENEKSPTNPPVAFCTDRAVDLSINPESPKSCDSLVVSEDASRLSGFSTTSQPSGSNHEILLEGRDIALEYDGKYIISGLNFSVREDEFVSIIGPSGVGKSTLLNCLAGFLSLDAGKILLRGREQKSEHFFAYMQQEDLLLPWLSVFENVSLYHKLQGRKLDSGVQAAILRDLQDFGLGEYSFALPDQLSGGMRQRAAFLRTVQSPAPILLLDEPFAASDAITRSGLQDWLLTLRQHLRRTVILVTHDLDEAIYLSDRILVLGGSPASVRLECTITCPTAERNRQWLYSQSSLKAELYHMLNTPNVAENGSTKGAEHGLKWC